MSEHTADTHRTITRGFSCFAEESDTLNRAYEMVRAVKEMQGRRRRYTFSEWCVETLMGRAKRTLKGA